MKKIFSSKKVLSVTLISVLIAVLVSALSVAAVEIIKKSDPVPGADAYGDYYDNSAGKKTERVFNDDSREITLKYDRTENLKSLAVSKRADKYGTYDVYKDSDGTEYLYLFNTDLFCGFMLSNVGMATEKEKAVPEEKALETANDFLKKYRDNYGDYKLASCEYGEREGYYDIKFYLPVCGYKSDDVFRIWVNAEGKVTSFSEFNYKRYEKLKIDPEKYDNAEKKISKNLPAQSEKIKVSVRDSYVSVDDKGKLILVNEVEITESNGKYGYSDIKEFKEVLE